MEEQTPTPKWWYIFLKPKKTREEIRNEYEMSYNSFMLHLTFHKIEFPPGDVTPKYQIMVYEAFGLPPYFYTEYEKIQKEKESEKKRKN